VVNRGEPIGSLFHYNFKELSSAAAAELSSLKLVEVVAYCLLPNHYHLLLKQTEDDGISKLMHKTGTGYTNHFNLKNQRSGSLFQGPFKAVEITSDDQLWYESAYILGNAQIHGLVEDFTKWTWCSWGNFAKDKEKYPGQQAILEAFSSLSDYKSYIKGVIENARSLKEARKVEESI
jgi:putative transposase